MERKSEVKVDPAVWLQGGPISRVGPPAPSRRQVTTWDEMFGGSGGSFLPVLYRFSLWFRSCALFCL